VISLWWLEEDEVDKYSMEEGSGCVCAGHACQAGQQSSWSDDDIELCTSKNRDHFQSAVCEWPGASRAATARYSNNILLFLMHDYEGMSVTKREPLQFAACSNNIASSPPRNSQSEHQESSSQEG